MNSCTLCQNPISLHVHRTEDEATIFCCKGCQVVYQILKVQGALERFQDHPVYQQAQRVGLIATPQKAFQESQEKKEEAAENDFQKIHLTILNMWCPSCAQVIHLILLKEKGIRHCLVDYSTDLAVIEYTPRFISKERIFQIIGQLGYHPQFLHDPLQRRVSFSLMLRFIIATFFSLNIMMFAYPIYATYFDAGDGDGYAMLFAWLSFGGALPVLTYSAWPIWRRLLTGWKVGIWGMETLVGLGVSAAIGLSLYDLLMGSPHVYFDSVTVIILFVLLGKIIESRAKFSAKEALFQLSLSLPKRGRKRLTNGHEQFVPIDEIEPGDFLVVRMGEKIVLDGSVEEGEGTVDESLITGESLPVLKKLKSKVIAGTLLQQGYLSIKVSRSSERSTLQLIIDSVAGEVEHKSRYVRGVDKIVRGFVPFVIFLALLTAISCLYWGVADRDQTVMQTAIIRAISVLLISCPCAIGIAVPVAESYLLNELARAGIIVRNRGCLSFLGRETLFVFDKTGTVTEGRFGVCYGLENISLANQKILKGLIAQSLHPIAVALNQALHCFPAPVERVGEITGKGIRGTFEGKDYYLGSTSFMMENGIALPFEKEEQQEGQSILTTIYFAEQKKCLSPIILGDQLRAGIREFIQFLHPIKTFLVSGDSASPVAKVAKICGFQESYAGFNPWQKRILINQLKSQGEIVAMLGDGMNDAPALTAAHIGIAVTSASDISVQVSDILMTTKNFQVLNLLRHISTKGRKIANQNLFWAFFYNFIGLGLAVMGMLTPLFAAFAMVMSSLMVLLNAQRMKIYLKSN